MTNEQAKSELMQIYGMLSEEMKRALDVLMAQADVLDKIRSEIEAIDTVKVRLCDCMNIIKSPQRIKDEVLEIIDKYRNEVSK